MLSSIRNKENEVIGPSLSSKAKSAQPNSAASKYNSLNSFSHSSRKKQQSKRRAFGDLTNRPHNHKETAKAKLKEKKTSKVKVSHVEDIEHFHLTRHHDQGYSVPGLDEDIIKCANLRAHIDCPDDPLDNYDFSKHIESDLQDLDLLGEFDDVGLMEDLDSIDLLE